MKKLTLDPLRLYVAGKVWGIPIFEDVFELENKQNAHYLNKGSALNELEKAEKLSFWYILKKCFDQNLILSETDAQTLKTYYPVKSSKIFSYLRKTIGNKVQLFFIEKKGEILFTTLLTVVGLFIFYIFYKGDTPITNVEKRIFLGVCFLVMCLICFALLRLYNSAVENSRTLINTHLANKKVFENFEKQVKKLK